MKSHKIPRVKEVQNAARFWRNLLARVTLGGQKVVPNKIFLSAGPVSLMREFNSYVRRMYTSTCRAILRGETTKSLSLIQQKRQDPREKQRFLYRDVMKTVSL